MKLTLLLGAFGFFIAPLCATEPPKNVILFVGDGMGLEQVRAAGLFLNGAAGQFSFEKFPYRSLMTTDNADRRTADSAASATAMATGIKVKNNVVSVRIPGDGSPVENLGEIFRKQGKKVGVVTTSHIDDATPAAFFAHAANRKSNGAIKGQYFYETKPDVLFGAVANLKSFNEVDKSYVFLTSVQDLQKISTGSNKKFLGQFFDGWYLEWEYRRLVYAPDQPSLSQMTMGALKALDNPKGFFLLVENELTDNAGHNEIPPGADRTRLMVEEVKALSDAVQTALNWVKNRTDTMIVVVADHESGDFSLLDSAGRPGVMPSCRWNSTGHTSKKVGVYGWGNGAALGAAAGVIQILDNTDVFRLLANRWGS